MALDQSYFDAISIDLVKKKYYNANKVEALLEDIRRQAAQLNSENERLSSQLFALNGQKNEIGDTLLSAKSIAQQIIAEAQEQADRLLAEAEQRCRALTEEAEQTRRAVLEDAEARRRELPRQLGDLERRLRKRMLSCLDEVSDELRTLSALAEAADSEPAGAEAETAPADLSEKVGAIAREIEAIEEE